MSVDGRNFSDRQKCLDHDERLFDVWLKGDGAEFFSFIRAAPDEQKERRAVIKKYFEWKTDVAPPK